MKKTENKVENHEYKEEFTCANLSESQREFLDRFETERLSKWLYGIMIEDNINPYEAILYMNHLIEYYTVTGKKDYDSDFIIQRVDFLSYNKGYLMRSIEK